VESDSRNERRDNKMICHCGKKLTKKKPFKGRTNVYFCKSCGCIYSLIVVLMSIKCSKEKMKGQTITLADIHKKRRKKYKRRKRKK